MNHAKDIEANYNKNSTHNKTSKTNNRRDCGGSFVFGENFGRETKLMVCERSKFSPSAKDAPKSKLPTPQYHTIANYAIICIAFLICVFNPYALYATDITQFDSTQTIATLSALFGVFLTSSFIAIYGISFIPARFAKIPAFVFSLTLFIGLIYSFILVGDYGAMDHFILQKPPDNNTQQILIFIATAIFGSAFIAIALKKLLRIWQITLLTLFIISVINATNIAIKRLDSTNFAESSANSHITPPICHFRNFFLTLKQRKISLSSYLICLVAHIHLIFWSNFRT